MDTYYCEYIQDTVYCNGICGECGNKEYKEEEHEETTKDRA